MSIYCMLLLYAYWRSMLFLKLNPFNKHVPMVICTRDCVENKLSADWGLSNVFSHTQIGNYPFIFKSLPTVFRCTIGKFQTHFTQTP